MEPSRGTSNAQADGVGSVLEFRLRVGPRTLLARGVKETGQAKLLVGFSMESP